jgi:hypothetical protein
LSVLFSPPEGVQNVAGLVTVRRVCPSRPILQWHFCCGVSCVRSSLTRGSFANPLSLVSRSLSQGQRIDADLSKAEADLQEALSRVSRLRQQREFLRKQSAELFARGMRDLDEEDGIATQEESILAEQQAVGEAQSLGAFGMVDWSAIDLSGFDVGEIAAEGAGPSSGA